MRQLRIAVAGQSLDAVLLTQSLEQLFGVEAVTIPVPGDGEDLGPVLRGQRLDGMVIGTPLPHRIGAIRAALDEGLPVLAEIPMTAELPELVTMLERRAQRPGPPLIPLTPWRFAPDLQLARGILSGGALGDPVSFHISLPAPQPIAMRRPAASEAPPASAQAVLMHHGWMGLDLLRHVVGEIVSLQAVRMRTAGGEGVEISVKCAGGWTGMLCLNAEGAPPGQWVILRGSDGAIELGAQSSAFIPTDGAAARIGNGCFGIENYERLANTFADLASFRLDPWIKDSDLMRGIELLSAAETSLGAGQPVEAPRRQRRIVAA